MKTKLVFLASAFFLSAPIYSQIGINTPTPSSTLDVSGSIEGNFREITTTYDLDAKDYHVSFSGALNSTLNLPAIAATDGSATDFTGRKYYIKNNSTTSTLALNAATGQTLRLGSNITNNNSYVLKPGKIAVLTANGTNGWDLSTDSYVTIIDSYANGPKVVAQTVPASGYYTLNDSPITLNVPTAGTKIVFYFTGLGTAGGSANSLGTLRFQLAQSGTAVATYPSVNMISWYNYSGVFPVCFSFKAAYSVTNLAPGTYTFSLQTKREAEAGSISDVTIWSSASTAQVYYK
ncbi:hypothetical protein [Chryseobacterium shigense]|uniref:DUF4397 domain-containing protein n=1 Tax=Chryseobacterium shigense TaxID=297244 RepID=A0A841N5H1_9FLAO|nr:hypothetical protein [Chryseobacterium shigense]MBB6370373.1 hypothetical protein [Chryseobacterium shigense]